MKKFLLVTTLLTISLSSAYANPSNPAPATTTNPVAQQQPVIKPLSQEAASKILTLSLNAPVITQIPIRENGDPLVNINDYANPRIRPIATIPGYESLLALAMPSDLVHLQRGEYNQIRKGLYDKLALMLTFLPPRVGIALAFGYHTPGKVQEKFEYILANNKTLYPSSEEAFNKTAELTGTNFHQTGLATGGRAIVAFFDINNNRFFDLGKIGFNTNNLSNDFFSINATETQKMHRNIMAEAAAKAGLVTYGKNWASLHYGDQVWAYITGSPTALYGSVNGADQHFIAKTKSELLKGKTAESTKDDGEEQDD